MLHNILLLHQGAIGDFVLTLSVVQAVRSHLLAAHVTAIASAPSARLAAGRSAVDEWQSPESVGLHSLFRDDGRLDDRLLAALRDAGTVLNFLSDAADPTHERLVSASRGSVISVDPRPTAETLAAGRHITDQWAETIRLQAIHMAEPTPPLIRMNPRDRSADPPGRRRRAIIHPGSGNRTKCWPIERFEQLADTLENVRISWLIGPAETESNDERVGILSARAVTGRESLVASDDLLQPANLIADADLYIGNDSGMTHVAAATGIPTVAIFGPTDPRVWRPLGEQVYILATDHPGDAITGVSVDQVCEQLLSIDS